LVDFRFHQEVVQKAMIIDCVGQIEGPLHMLGNAAVPVYLWDGERPIVFDAGFAFLGRVYAAAIEATLGGRQPSVCALTHSHFDHCGAAGYFKRRFPGLRTAAAEHAQAILARPNAISLMQALTKAAVQTAAINGFAADPDIEFEPFGIDRVLKEGDVLHPSDDTAVQVLATPGHTRDCLSFYIPSRKVLIASEAAGIMDTTGYIVSDCLVDYDMYLDSLKRLSRLDVDILCLGHRYALSGEDARRYLSRSIAHCLEFRDIVAESLDRERNDLARTVQAIKAWEYDGKPEPKQPEPAYRINLEARVNAVAKHLGKSLS
jgi:glyoxylase-like metal-dependent hydrolase (beta-lactamase superfamily II)